MFCTNCGAQNNDGARFCVNCGAPLEAKAQRKAGPQMREKMRDPRMQDPRWGQEPLAAPQKRSMVPIIIAIAAVLVLGGVTFGVVHYVGTFNHQTETATEETDSSGEDNANGYSDEDNYDYETDGSEDYGLGHDDDIIPYSSEEYLSDSDVAGMTKRDMQYAANEIYARHGAEFEDSDVIRYFNAKDWYDPYQSKASAEQDFSDVEKTNLDFLYHQIHD